MEGDAPELRLGSRHVFDEIGVTDLVHLAFQ